jgi:hypothetical protein
MPGPFKTLCKLRSIYTPPGLVAPRGQKVLMTVTEIKCSKGGMITHMTPIMSFKKIIQTFNIHVQA